MKKAKSKTAGQNVGSKVEALMAEEKPTEKSRRTLYLNDANYKKLEKICSSKRTSPSVMVDALIEDFLQRHAS
jgi:hypothetical protein